MATISACTSTSSVARAAFLQKPSAPRPAAIVVALPALRKSVGKVMCSMEGRPQQTESKFGMASMVAAACAAALSSPSAMALVDERMSTEGTGLPFGLSNNLLGWILLGVFGLIWTFYFTYVGGLDEDEESGLSL